MFKLHLLPLLFLFGLSIPLLAQDSTVVSVIVGSDDHTTLETAVTEAGLVETLSGDGPFTVFAPTDAAFAALPAGTLDFLLDTANRDSLVAILTYHVVGDSVRSSTLTDGMKVATLNADDSLSVGVNGTEITINGALVTVADITADNGVVHVIDAVLLPRVTTSTGEPAFAAGVRIAPNPAAGYTIVFLPEELLGRAELTLRNLDGRTITRLRATDTRQRIDVAALPSGTYLLEVRAAAGRTNRRIVVQR